MSQEVAGLVAAFGIVGVIFGGFLLFCIGGIFTLWFSGRLLSLPKASLGNAFIASLATTFATFGLSILLTPIPLLGNFIGWAGGLVISVMILQSLFETEPGPAIACLLLSWVFNAILGIFLVFGGMVTITMIGVIMG